jgi:hypothetical protein
MQVQMMVPPPEMDTVQKQVLMMVRTVQKQVPMMVRTVQKQVPMMVHTVQKQVLMMVQKQVLAMVQKQVLAMVQMQVLAMVQMQVLVMVQMQVLEMDTVQKQVPMIVPAPPPEMHTVQAQVRPRLHLPSDCRHPRSHQQQVHQDPKNQAPSASHTWPSLVPTQGGASSLVPHLRPSVRQQPHPQPALWRSSLKKPPFPQCSDQQTEDQHRQPPQPQICSPSGAGAARGSPGDGVPSPPCQPCHREGRTRWARPLTSEATSSWVEAAAPGGSSGSRPHSS